MYTIIQNSLLILFGLLSFTLAHAAPPTITFSDLVSGPATGLGDGKGSGAIVTVWGQNLGNTQANSSIEFCDSTSTCRAGNVYYWKNADGTLPGGPANLYKSHRMQEIAFSIPALSANGSGAIRITVDGETVQLPFTVRAGRILHVKPSGDNNNNCTFTSPCAFVNGDINSTTSNVTKGVGNRLQAGDIVYSHGVLEPEKQTVNIGGTDYTAFFGGGRSVGLYLRGAHGTENSPIALIAYPDSMDFTRVVAGSEGLNPYVSEGIILSKYSISVGAEHPSSPPTPAPPSKSSIHISTSKWGRSIGNLLLQNDDTCFTGYAGAITSGREGAHKHKVLGNEISNLGCDNSSRYSHTLYLSIRDEGSSIEAPEIAYNYLHDNNVIFGIHAYDESYSGDCGTMTGTIKVNNNVIVNQRGAGISIRGADHSGTINTCWDADIEIHNNLLMNVGLGAPAEDNVRNPDAILVGQGMGSSVVSIKNNTVFGWGEPISFFNNGAGANGEFIEVDFDLADPQIYIENNVAIQTSVSQYAKWFESSEPNVHTNNNLLWNTLTQDGNNAPSWAHSIIADPKLTVENAVISLDTDSPLRNVVNNSNSKDLYGIQRGASSAIGAIEPEASALILSENFDKQADWATAGRHSLPTLPQGWDSGRTDEEWHPSDGDTGFQPSMQINGNHSNQVYGGTGKAFINYAESFNATDDNGWSSDGQITKDLAGYSEIYAKFNIKFAPDFADNLSDNFATSKIFRVGYWDGTGSRYKFFSNGNSGPLYIWNWYVNSYGARNQNAFRCAPQTSNYYCGTPQILNSPRAVTTGDMNANFTTNVAALAPKIPDLVNGGFLPYTGIVSHEQVWGSIWHTLEFHLKMNSLPGEQDGVLQMWLDGEKLISMNEIPWIGTGGDPNIKWNILSIGGNDHHHVTENGVIADKEYWYAIDNLEVYNKLPAGPKALAIPPPNFSGNAK